LVIYIVHRKTANKRSNRHGNNFKPEPLKTSR